MNFIKTTLKTILEVAIRYGMFMLALWLTCEIVNGLCNRGFTITDETAVLIAITAVIYTAMNRFCNACLSKALRSIEKKIKED